jgi:hypothetical protein
MNRWLNFLSRLLTEERGEVDLTPAPAPAADPAPPGDPIPVSGDPAPASDPAAPPASDPNDPLSALEEAMKAQLGSDLAPTDPNAPPVSDPGAIPEQFQAALEISPFVSTPEAIPQAIRAADEVWKVAAGQIPARQLLEGFKAGNPQGFEKIAADLREYLGVTAQPQASPLDELKTANPDAYKQLATWFEQTTGKPLDGPADPRDARLTQMEQRIAQEDKARADATWNEQVTSARTKALDVIGKSAKGTFAEGDEAYFLQQCAAKIQIPQEQVVQMILAGNTKPLEKAYKEVFKEEAERVKRFSDRIVKQYRTLKNAVPAGKNNPAGSPQSAKDARLAPLPNESASDHAARLIKLGLL